MKRSTLFFGLWLVLTSSAVIAQTNVRGWYAEGQVWIMWDIDNNPPETYGIYSSANPFTNTSQAQLVGRLYEEEWTPSEMRKQVSANANFVIPDGSGGRFTVSRDAGLFVETVHETGAKYYAVVKWGNTAVTANNLSARIAYRFSLNEPVQAQSQGTVTLASGHKTTAYYSWADGRDNHWEGRPDYPVMANHHKNGMPSFYIVSEAKNLPAGKVSAVHWLHGFSGSARQQLPEEKAAINIEPQDGLLVAHNDEFIHKILLNNSVPVKYVDDSFSWWFGWAKQFNPFEALPTTPANNDTVINYTQRRLLWFNAWLIKNRNVDPERVFIQGYSMGSAGTTALAKAFPNVFGSVSIFNNGFEGPNGDISSAFMGTPTQNLPTNLINDKGQPVRMYEVFDLSTRISSERDLPVWRSWHGKNDVNETMRWDANVVAEYKRADANGSGMQLFWDERPHVFFDSLKYHWIMGLSNLQTERDDAAYQTRYRVHQSYPAFYNHQNYPGANKNPGDGTRGTGSNGVGDDWGSFGGYHDWDVNSIVDTPGRWEVTAYLIGQSSHTVDNSIDASLTSDLAIRKPQQFKPPAGRQLQWSVTRLSNGQVLQSGTTMVGADDFVSIAGITLFKDPDRVRIRVSDPTVAVESRDSEILPTEFSLSQNYPNPFNPNTVISFQLSVNSHVTLKVFDVNGREVATLLEGEMAAGSHSVSFAPHDLAGGIYFYQLTAGKFSQTRKAVLIQ